MTLNSVSMNIARVFGAALGGVLAAALGLALCFALNAVSFGAVLVSLVVMRAADLFPARRVTREPGQIRQGLRYVRGTPELLIPLVMIAVIGTLAWEFPVSLPLMASKVFGGGAAAYGVMASVMGVGAVAGGLVSAARARPRGRALCLSAIGWGIAILLAAVAPTMPLELAALVFVGYGSITFNSMAKTVLQLAAEADDARPGDGAVGTGLARLDPDRRLHRRLDRPGRGRPLVARGRRPGHAPLRPARLPGPHPHRPPHRAAAHRRPAPRTPRPRGIRSAPPRDPCRPMSLSPRRH